MSFKLYNTLTRRREDFTPIDPNEVRMYTCGPTVYGYAHIGNFRAYMFEDLLRRYLKFLGYKVTQVMNLTDVDDKTIKNSIAEKKGLNQYTEPFKKAFFDDLETLAIERAEYYPAATDHIDEMVELIKKLIEKGIAYKGEDGTWYFSIARFNGYGKLANMKQEDLRVGVRISQDEYEKDEARDFALWKAWTEEDGDVFWETELGKGRPGWHIECSAMSMKYLGNHFDIHTGGIDNMFPHHENEIAQSEAATGEKFVDYWLHCDHLIVEGEKMAKSAGNFFTLRDVIDKGYHPLAVRYLLLTTHYRKKLNFTWEGLKAAASNLQRIWGFVEMLSDIKNEGPISENIKNIVEKSLKDFTESMDNDLNISGAMGHFYDMIRDINRHNDEVGLTIGDRDRILEVLHKMDIVLGFVFPKKDEELPELDFNGQTLTIEELIKMRLDAKKQKNFQLADKIRDFIGENGYILEDTREGTKWKKKI